jgi:hypothetical protein
VPRLVGDPAVGSVHEALTTRKRYDAMISSLIGPHLRQKYFRKRRNTFCRATEHGSTSIDFQASQFGTRDEVRFTNNLGLNFVEFQDGADGLPSLGGHIHQRIGWLLPRGRDYWWKLDPTSDLDAVGAEIIASLDEHALPWLEEREVLETVLAAVRSDPDFIKPWQISPLSVLAARSGDTQLAVELRELADRRQAALQAERTLDETGEPG